MREYESSFYDKNIKLIVIDNSLETRIKAGTLWQEVFPTNQVTDKAISEDVFHEVSHAIADNIEAFKGIENGVKELRSYLKQRPFIRDSYIETIRKFQESGKYEYKKPFTITEELFLHEFFAEYFSVFFSLTTAAGHCFWL